MTVRLGASNVYLLQSSDGVIAIDAGPDYDGAWQSAATQLAGAGLAPSDVISVLVTHGHPDHCALASSWQREAGAEVWSATGEAAGIEAGGREPPGVRDVILDVLAANGVPSELVESVRPARRDRTSAGPSTGNPERLRNLRSIAPEHGEWPSPLRPTPATPDRTIDAERPIDFGDLRLRAFLCPGHTPASTVFLNEATGDLYTGDHVLERIAPTPGIQIDKAGGRIRSLPQYLRSLAAVRSLAPARVLPGHGAPFSDLSGAVDRITGIFNQRATRLLRRLHAGPATAWELATRLYPHLQPAATWIVMAEVIGLLDLLEEREQVSADVEHVIRFRT